MHESSKNLQACLADMYEQDWYGKNEVDSIVEVRNTFYYFFKSHIKWVGYMCVQDVCA